ncbi:MAG: 2-keto-4-pentenoate hydratase [Acidimicrobiales bacterium]
MIGDADAREFAAELRAAELGGPPAALPTERFAGFGWDDARRIALARDALRHDDGDTPIGYKLGWTSAAMRSALGIDQPNWGTLWASQRIAGELDLEPLRHPKAEPEVVYVAGADLADARIDADDVIEAAAGWAVGIEVVHPRYASYGFTWLDNTADNSSAGAIATGPSSAAGHDPMSARVLFTDGAEQRTGSADQAMGSPAEAVAWLVRRLVEEGRSLRAGEIVYTGGLTAPFDVSAGNTYTARSTLLGEATFAAIGA